MKGSFESRAVVGCGLVVVGSPPLGEALGPLCPFLTDEVEEMRSVLHHPVREMPVVGFILDACLAEAGSQFGLDAFPVFLGEWFLGYCGHNQTPLRIRLSGCLKEC